MQSKFISCWKCSKAVEVPQNQIPFKSLCDSCHSWQHACVNCHYHQKGLPNNCRIPNTEHIRDCESYNLCDEFKLRDPLNSNEKSPSISDISKNLFGDNDVEENSSESAKERFNKLFDDSSD